MTKLIGNNFVLLDQFSTTLITTYILHARNYTVRRHPGAVTSYMQFLVNNCNDRSKYEFQIKRTWDIVFPEESLVTV